MNGTTIETNVDCSNRMLRLIALGKIPEVLDQLVDGACFAPLEEAAALSARHDLLQKNIMKGVLLPQEVDVAYNRFRDALTMFLGSLKDPKEVAQRQAQAKKKQKVRFVLAMEIGIVTMAVWVFRLISHSAALVPLISFPVSGTVVVKNSYYDNQRIDIKAGVYIHADSASPAESSPIGDYELEFKVISKGSRIPIKVEVPDTFEVVNQAELSAFHVGEQKTLDILLAPKGQSERIYEDLVTRNLHALEAESLGQELETDKKKVRRFIGTLTRMNLDLAGPEYKEAWECAVAGNALSLLAAMEPLESRGWGDTY